MRCNVNVVFSIAIFFTNKMQQHGENCSCPTIGSEWMVKKWCIPPCVRIINIIRPYSHCSCMNNVVEFLDNHDALHALTTSSFLSRYTLYIIDEV